MKTVILIQCFSIYNSEQCLHLWLETLCACEEVVGKWYVNCLLVTA